MCLIENFFFDSRLVISEVEFRLDRPLAHRRQESSAMLHSPSKVAKYCSVPVQVKSNGRQICRVKTCRPFCEGS